MNRRIGAVVAAAVIIVFVAFIIYDMSGDKLFADKTDATIVNNVEAPAAAWQNSSTIDFPEGKLKAIATTTDGRIVAAGETFLTLLDEYKNREWTVDPGAPVTALAVYENTIYAATQSTIHLFSLDGTALTEWGPYEDKSIITSISANNGYVVFSDAGTKRVYILTHDGSLTSFFGHEGERFIIPSAYFDIKIMPDNTLHVVNPGKTRIETRDLKGNILTLFGEPGTANEAFVPCCNPSHFAMFGDSLFVTSEKSIHRIKIYSSDGLLKEFVSVPGQFESALPFDLATGTAGEIYAASEYDSKIFIFTRIQ
jgi:hypothetical protein